MTKKPSLRLQGISRETHDKLASAANSRQPVDFLGAEFVVDSVGCNITWNEPIYIAELSEVIKTPKPPKFPIGSRVAVNSPVWSSMPDGMIGIVSRRDISGLFLVQVDGGCNIWAHPDMLTAVEVEA